MNTRDGGGFHAVKQLLEKGDEDRGAVHPDDAWGAAKMLTANG